MALQIRYRRSCSRGRRDDTCHRRLGWILSFHRVYPDSGRNRGGGGWIRGRLCKYCNKCANWAVLLSDIAATPLLYIYFVSRLVFPFSRISPEQSISGTRGRANENRGRSDHFVPKLLFASPQHPFLYFWFCHFHGWTRKISSIFSMYSPYAPLLWRETSSFINRIRLWLWRRLVYFCLFIQTLSLNFRRHCQKIIRDCIIFILFLL